VDRGTSNVLLGALPPRLPAETHVLSHPLENMSVIVGSPVDLGKEGAQTRDQGEDLMEIQVMIQTRVQTGIRMRAHLVIPMRALKMVRLMILTEIQIENLVSQEATLEMTRVGWKLQAILSILHVLSTSLIRGNLALGPMTSMGNALAPASRNSVISSKDPSYVKLTNGSFIIDTTWRKYTLSHHHCRFAGVAFSLFKF
jgi:hypothetical protein